jgi:hypothetical protein
MADMDRHIFSGGRGLPNLMQLSQDARFGGFSVHTWQRWRRSLALVWVPPPSHPRHTVFCLLSLVTAHPSTPALWMTADSEELQALTFLAPTRPAARVPQGESEGRPGLKGEQAPKALGTSVFPALWRQNGDSVPSSGRSRWTAMWSRQAGEMAGCRVVVGIFWDAVPLLSYVVREESTSTAQKPCCLRGLLSGPLLSWTDLPTSSLEPVLCFCSVCFGLVLAVLGV